MKEYNPRVVFIGCGNLSTHLSKALMNEGGCSIVQLYSRTVQSASTLSARLGDVPYTNEITELFEADLYICALKDSVIEEVLEKADIIRGKRIVHTAGSVSAEMLSRFTDEYGVFYPLQSFSKNKEVDFKKIPFFIEASSQTFREDLVTLATHISDKSYLLDSEKRKQIHLAAVFVSNFVNHLYAVGEKMMVEAGVPFEALLPLIEEVTEKVHTMSPVLAQTGPAVRRDKNVLSMHEAMLEEHPDWLQLYKQLTQSIQNMK